MGLIVGKFTVFGGRGFIGSEFVKELSNQGHEVYVPQRDDEKIYNSNLGIVIYSAGYGDCQKDPFSVLTANVILLSEILQKAKFEKLVYISSTRVYMNQELSNENSNLIICEDDSRRLFNLTKITAEELCLKSNKDCLIIRPSNVYGAAIESNLFLPSIIKNAVNNGVVDMYVSPDYSKDYISVFDVVESTLKLITVKTERKVFNLGSGTNISANSIAEVLKEETKCKINWVETLNSSKEIFPITNISELEKLISFKPKFMLNDLKELIKLFRISINKK